ncbi:lysM domain receptor-like kinase 4 [Sarracenia purpurea var. burkii]
MEEVEIVYVFTARSGVGLCFVFLCFFFPQKQQPYVGKATTLCSSADNSTSVLGYTCNGVNTTCQSYLTFRSNSPYTTVSSISQLLSADPSHLSQLNSVAENATFATDTVVLVPVNCSCSGDYYQSNSSYVVQLRDSYLSIANNTFQGLSTCQALQAQNAIPDASLSVGTRITITLRGGIVRHLPGPEELPASSLTLACMRDGLFSRLQYLST